MALKACNLLNLSAADIRHVLRTFPVSTVILEVRHTSPFLVCYLTSVVDINHYDTAVQSSHFPRQHCHPRGTPGPVSTVILEVRQRVPFFAPIDGCLHTKSNFRVGIKF